ncbi:MAG: hypothetical protein LC790_08670, partial [Actinobacteria bacterium]|nr:hypothetical protein [Actinomycetota bacterium]MCA1698957.1 hypothetical protein [Actinomycetota bacterium]
MASGTTSSNRRLVDRRFLSYFNTTISVTLDPGYTFAETPGIGANGCAITPTVTQQSPTVAYIYFAGSSPA